MLFTARRCLSPYTSTPLSLWVRRVSLSCAIAGGAIITHETPATSMAIVIAFMPCDQISFWSGYTTVLADGIPSVRANGRSSDLQPEHERLPAYCRQWLYCSSLKGCLQQRDCPGVTPDSLFDQFMNRMQVQSYAKNSVCPTEYSKKKQQGHAFTAPIGRIWRPYSIWSTPE